jgi:hypothetical protein
MPPRDLNDAKYWRGQAAELRARAKTYKNEFAAQRIVPEPVEIGAAGAIS